MNLSSHDTSGEEDTIVCQSQSAEEAILSVRRVAQTLKYLCARISYVRHRIVAPPPHPRPPSLGSGCAVERIMLRIC